MQRCLPTSTVSRNQPDGSQYHFLEVFDVVHGHVVVDAFHGLEEMFKLGNEASAELVERIIGALVLHKELYLYQPHSVAPEGSRGVVGADACRHLLVVIGQHFHDGFGRSDFV